MSRFILLITLLTGAGCATVHPPMHPVDPVPIYLTDYGIHSSLILPKCKDCRFIEYAYGDWGYSVQNQNSPMDALGALTVSKKPAFGCRVLSADGSGTPVVPDNIAPSLRKMTRLYVARSNVLELEKNLADRFSRGGAATTNPSNGMEYVTDAEHYSFAHNCNHLTADCLRKLGCRIDGWVLFSKFAVAEPCATPVIPQK